MLTFSKALVGTLLVLGRALCQEDSGAFDSVPGMISGFVGLRMFIKSVVKASNRGNMGREAVRLTPPRQDYDIAPEAIKYFLKHSMLAVCKPEEAQTNTCFCQGKFEKARVFRNDTLDSQGVVAVDPLNRLIVVSYRLTVSTKNYDTDYDIALVNYPTNNGKEKVHRGNLIFFKSLHHQMEPIVVSLLKKPEHQGYKLHLTGYSLGAAVSAVALPAWINTLKVNKLDNKMQVYTYSGPRPGNVEYARYLEGLGVPIVRYAKRGDAVPLSPDQKLGYSQVGLEFFDDSSNYRAPLRKCAANVIEDKACSLGVRQFFAFHHLIPFKEPIPLPPFC